MKKFFLYSLIFLLSCGMQKKNPLIFISIDNLSTEYLEKMQNLKNLSGETVTFPNCFTQYPFCLPSYISILTSTSFIKNKCYLNEFYYLNKNIKSVAEILKKNGYKTFAFVSGKPLKKISGINKGFDLYNDLFYQGFNKNLLISYVQKENKNIYLSYRPAEETLALALNAVKGEKRGYFLFIQLSDSYPPFSPPQEFANKNSKDPFLSTLFYIDNELGKFFKELEKEKIYDKALIVITSDHGTVKDESDAGMKLSLENLKVPLLMKFPKNFKIQKKEINDPVSLTSIFPTILSFLKIKDKDYLKQSEGEDLKDLILYNRREKKFEIPCLTLVPYHYYGLNPSYCIINEKGKIKEEKNYFENYKITKENLDFYKEILKTEKLLEENMLKESQEILSKYYGNYKNTFVYLKALLQEKIIEKDLKAIDFCLENLRENFGESPALDFEKYILFLKFGEGEKALKLLYNSMEKYGPMSNIIFEAFSLEQIKDKEEMKNFIKKIPSGYESNVGYILEGIKNLFEKNEEVARENFEKAIIEGAEIPIPYFQVGLLLKKEMKLKDSLPYLYSAFILNQNNPRFLYELGDTFALLGDFERANNFFKKAYEIQPSNMSIGISYLKTLFLTNKKEEVQVLKNEIIKTYGAQIEELKKQDKLLEEIISGSP